MTTDDRPATQRLGALRQAAQDARQAAAKLRDRVRRGDGLVTPRELSEADAAVEISELRLERAEEEAKAEQEAERKAANDAAVEQYLVAEADMRAQFVEAAKVVRQAMARLAEVAASHGQILAAAGMAASGAPEEYRLHVNRYTGVTLDRKPLPVPIDPSAWLFRLYAEMTDQVGSTDPKLYPIEAQTVPGGRGR